MPLPLESWQPLADTLGFQDEREMLTDLYCKQNFSLLQLRAILGYSTWAIRRRLMKYGIELRGRGGMGNRLGKRRLKHLTDEELDKTAVSIIARKYDVHTSTVYAELKLREEEKRKKLNEVLLHHACTDVSSLREALKHSHGSGSTSEKP